VKKEAVFIERLLMFDGVSGEKVIDIRSINASPSASATPMRSPIAPTSTDPCWMAAGAPRIDRAAHQQPGGRLRDRGGGVRVKLASGEALHGAALIAPMAGSR